MAGYTLPYQLTGPQTVDSLQTGSAANFRQVQVYLASLHAGSNAPTGPAGGSLTGTYPNPGLGSGVVADTNVAAGAAIAYSKLALTGSIVTGDLAFSSLPPNGAASGDLTGTYPAPTIATGAVTSAKILDGTIANVDISGSAAIAYSKLNLSGSVATTDLNFTPVKSGDAAGGSLTGTYPNPTIASGVVTSAMIVDGTIVNADVSGSAAIAYSKLSLTGSIVNADISGQAAISPQKIDGGPASTLLWSDGTAGNGVWDTSLWDTGTYAGGVGWVSAATAGLLSSTAAAGGDLTGNYPNPTIKSSVGLSGAPTAATAAQDTNTTQLASTAFVLGQAGSSTPLIDGTATAGVSKRWTPIDHVHPTDTSRLSATAAAGGDLTGNYPNPTIGAGKVTSTAILDGTILNADINASAGVTIDKLAGATAPTGTYNFPTLQQGGSAVVVTTDSRLSDARTPTGAAGGDLSGTYPNPRLGTPDSLTKAQDAADEAQDTVDAHILQSTAAHGGIVATTDPRLSDSRNTTGTAGGDLSGTYPNPTVAKLNGQLPSFYLSRANHTGTQAASTISDFATTVSSNAVAGDVGGTIGATTITGLSISKVAAGTAPAGTYSFPTLQQGGVGVVVTTDSRLSDARTPTAHESTHLTGSTDVIDGDQLDITYAPSGYLATSDAIIGTVHAALGAHLRGIGIAISQLQDAGADALDEIEAVNRVKGTRGGDAWSGAHDFTGATLNVFTFPVNRNTHEAASTSYADAAAAAAVITSLSNPLWDTAVWNTDNWGGAQTAIWG